MKNEYGRQVRKFLLFTRLDDGLKDIQDMYDAGDISADEERQLQSLISIAKEGISNFLNKIEKRSRTTENENSI